MALVKAMSPRSYCVEPSQTFVSAPVGLASLKDIWCPLKSPVPGQYSLGSLKHFLNFVNWHNIAQIWFSAWNIQYQPRHSPQIEIPISVWSPRDPFYLLVVVQKPLLFMLGPDFPSLPLYRI